MSPEQALSVLNATLQIQGQFDDWKEKLLRYCEFAPKEEYFYKHGKAKEWRVKRCHVLKLCDIPVTSHRAKMVRDYLGIFQVVPQELKGLDYYRGMRFTQEGSKLLNGGSETFSL